MGAVAEKGSVDVEKDSANQGSCELFGLLLEDCRVAIR